MIFFLIINVFFIWFFWKLADDAFAQGENARGWMDVGVSALNFAVLLNFLL
jgi:hypothetical protein